MNRSPLRRLVRSLFGSSRLHAPATRRPRRPFKPQIEFLEDRTVPATFTEAGGTLTLSLAANEQLSIVANAASYTLSLSGGNWTGTDSANVTGNGTATLTVTRDAFTTIDIGDAGTGTAVSFADSGVNTYTDGFSVTLDNTPAATALSFTGASAFDTGGSLTATVAGAAVILGTVSTSSGNISITATGSGAADVGIVLLGTLSSPGSGTLTLDGTGGSNAAGVQLDGTLSSTGGDISVIATRGASGSTALLLDASASVTVSGTADLSLIANSIDINATASITATGRSVSIVPETTGTSIDLGGADGATTLGLTDAELERISGAATLIIGSASAGAINIGSQINLTGNADTLHLITGAAVTDGTGSEQTDLTVTSLAIEAATGIGSADDLNVQITNLAASNSGGSSSGNIQISNSGALIVGTVDGVNGVQRSGGTAGNIVLTAASPLTINSPVLNDTGGDITLTAGAANSNNAGDVLTIDANVTASGGNGNITLNGNSLVVNPTATANDVTISAAGTGTITGNFNGTAGTISITEPTGNTTLVTTANGDLSLTTAATLTITGQDAGDGATVQTTGAGNILLTADLVTLSNNAVVQTTGTGNITFTNDDLDVNTTASITTPATQIVTVANRSANRAINLGTDTDLGLADSGLNRFSTGVIRVGSANAGAITVSAAIDLTTGGLNPVPVLHLISGAGASQTGSGALTVASLAIEAGSTVDLSSNANNVINLAVSITNGSLLFLESNTLNINTVDGVVGVSVSNDVTLTTNSGSISVQQPISATMGNVTLNSANTLTLSANVNSGGTTTLNPAAGGVSQTAGSITAATLSLTGAGTFSLDSATNNVATLTAAVTGAVTYRDLNDLTTQALSTGSQTLTLNVGGSLFARGDVAAGPATITASGNLVLERNGTVGGSTPINFNAGAQNITLNGGQAGASQITVAAEFTANQVFVNGGPGADLFRIRPTLGPTLITVDGRDPIVVPGDRLSLISVPGVSFSGPNLDPGNPRNGTFTFTFPGGQTRLLRFISIENLNAGVALEVFSYLQGLQPQLEVRASTVSADGGQVTVASSVTGQPFIPNFGGVFVVNPNLASPSVSPSAPRVAVGDVNGDGTPDIVVAQGPANDVQPLVTVLDGNAFITPGRGFNQNTDILAQFLAYDPNFRGGMFVGVGDLDNDGFAEIVTGADAGGGPHVKTFTAAKGAGGQPIVQGGRMFFQPFAGPLGSFFAYSANFTGGVRVAIGDVNGDGFRDVIFGAGAGGGPHVRAVDRFGNAIVDFFAFTPTFAGGVYVGAGNVDPSSPNDEIIIGAGLGGGPHVKVVRLAGFAVGPNGQVADSALVASFFASQTGVDGSFQPLSNLMTSGVGSVSFGILIDAPNAVPTGEALPTPGDSREGMPVVLVGTARGQRVQGYARVMGDASSIALIDRAFQDGLNIAGSLPF